MRYYLLLFLLTSTAVATAQITPAYPRKEVEYRAADNTKLPSAEGANRRIERTYRDSVSGAERRYDAAGRLVSFTSYGRFVPLIRHGSEFFFYANGKVRSRTDYKLDKRDGVLEIHYPDGQLERRETYRADVRQTGECFAEDGSSVEFFEHEALMPKYNGGGLITVKEAIIANLTYPLIAQALNLQGQVYVSFVVSAQGDVEDIKIVKGTKELGEAVVAAVKKLGRFTPARRDGKAVPVSFTVPIIFSL